MQARWTVTGAHTVRFEGVGVPHESEQRWCASGTPPRLEVDYVGGVSAYALSVAILLENPLGAALLITGAMALVVMIILPLLPAAPPAPAESAPFEQRAQYAVRGCLSLIGGIALILCATGMLLEGALRLYFSRFGSQDDLVRYVLPGDQFPNLEPLFLPLPMVNYGLAPAYGGHNRLGWRGPEIAIPKPEDTYRIVAMGGSSVYGPAESWEQAYPAHLQNVLRDDYGYAHVEVINAGTQAYTTWNTVAGLATRVLALEPDLVIIYDGFNDVLAREAPPECYAGLNPLRGLDPHWSLNVDETPDLSPLAAQRFLMINLGMMADPAGFSGLFEPYRIECADGVWTLDAFNPQPVGVDNFPHNPPIYFEQNLRSAAGLARAHNIPLMFSTFGYDADSPGLLPHWQQGMDEHNAIITRLAAEYDLLYLDYAALAPQDASYWNDYIHLNDAGGLHQAQAYAAYLDEMGVMSPDA
jgi:hypothetical protein